MLRKTRHALKKISKKFKYYQNLTKKNISKQKSKIIIFDFNILRKKNMFLKILKSEIIIFDFFFSNMLFRQILIIFEFFLFAIFFKTCLVFLKILIFFLEICAFFLQIQIIFLCVKICKKYVIISIFTNLSLKRWFPKIGVFNYFFVG